LASFLLIPLSQFPKRLVIFFGGDKSKVIYMSLQINLARGENMCITENTSGIPLPTSFNEIVFS
jgi:hypothetical protein